MQEWGTEEGREGILMKGESQRAEGAVVEK